MDPEKIHEAMNKALYDDVGEAINRMGLKFDAYTETYHESLNTFIEITDGDEIGFLHKEITTYEEILDFTEQEYTEEGIDKRSWLWDIRESYRPWIKRIHEIYFINSDSFENSNRRKILFLKEKQKSLGVEQTGLLLKTSEEINAAVDLKKSLLLLHYLDRAGHLKFEKIHPDKTTLSKILSFLIGKSHKAIYQHISPGNISKMKETKGVLISIKELLTPFKNDFPDLLKLVEEDLKKHRNK